MKEKLERIISDYNNGWITWSEAKERVIGEASTAYCETFGMPFSHKEVAYDAFILFGMLIKENDLATEQNSKE